MDTANKIKFVFTGCVGAGKTTAIAAISEVDPVSTEAKPSEGGVVRRKKTTTVAMDYGELTLAGGDKLYLYGTPGQRRFDFMCHILTEGALGLIILIDNTHPDPLAELDYFLNLNAAFLQKSAAVIGISHFDEATQPTIDDYYQALEERGDPWPVIHVDARVADDVIILLDTLLATLEYS
ncbi:MAG: GTP-binding protein [Methyloprofundus sp.]|nr:GTP-binding protein [Methyloprofundus sp.]